MEGSARTSGIWLAAGASSYPSYPRPSRFQQHAAIMRYVYTPYNIPNGKCSRNQHERYEHAGVSSITLQEGYLESVMVHRVKHAESFRKDSTQQAWLFSFLECRYPLKCTHVRYERDNDRSLVADRYSSFAQNFKEEASSCVSHGSNVCSKGVPANLFYFHSLTPRARLPQSCVERDLSSKGDRAPAHAPPAPKFSAIWCIPPSFITRG